ncbi:MAG TPA: BrnT family toxin [Candidatus Hydrogenedentes bacterium]|nr:BrnT family toxin [Candidatus Hydrogenedentota bacterium]
MYDRFEWDEANNALNIQRHGIDFVDVSEMFDYPMVTFLDQRADYGEDRWVGIGHLGPRLAVVIFTETQDSVIRIISARKATIREEAIYRDQI